MRKHKRSGGGRSRLLGVPLLSFATLIGLFAAPAAASETVQGSGHGVGYGNVDVQGNPQTPLCLPASANATYVLDVAHGSVSAAETTPTANAAEYAGPLTVTITLGAHNFNPAGTFASTNTMCSGAPQPIPATISVAGSFQGGSVSCPADTGSWLRVNTTVTFNEVGNDGDGSCTVTSLGGSPSVTVTPVTHAFDGNEHPCLSPPSPPSPPGVTTCPGPVETVHVQGDWTVTAANP